MQCVEWDAKGLITSNITSRNTFTLAVPLDQNTTLSLQSCQYLICVWHISARTSLSFWLAKKRSSLLLNQSEIFLMICRQVS